MIRSLYLMHPKVSRGCLEVVNVGCFRILYAGVLDTLTGGAVP